MPKLLEFRRVLFRSIRFSFGDVRDVFPACVDVDVLNVPPRHLGPLGLYIVRIIGLDRSLLPTGIFPKQQTRLLIKIEGGRAATDYRQYVCLSIQNIGLAEIGRASCRERV